MTIPQQEKPQYHHQHLVDYDDDDDDDDDDYSESEGSDPEYDDPDMDPTYSILEETQGKLSTMSIGKKSKSRVAKAAPEDAEAGKVEEKSFEEVQRMIQAGKLEKLKLEQCKVYLRKHGLRLTGNKDTLIQRIKEHQEVLNGGGEKKYPVSSFVVNCKGDACTGDVVMFEQNVYEMYSIVSRSASAPSCGTRTVAGRIVKESYGAAKQQHTFTIEVLWSKGEKPLPPLHPLLIKGRNLYRLKTLRQRWEDEGERCKVLTEKHLRGSVARSDRETRVQQKQRRKMLREPRGSKKVGMKSKLNPSSKANTVSLAQQSDAYVNLGKVTNQGQESGSSIDARQMAVQRQNPTPNIGGAAQRPAIQRQNPTPNIGGAAQGLAIQPQKPQSVAATKHVDPLTYSTKLTNHLLRRSDILDESRKQQAVHLRRQNGQIEINNCSQVPENSVKHGGRVQAVTKSGDGGGKDGLPARTYNQPQDKSINQFNPVNPPRRQPLTSMNHNRPMSPLHRQPLTSMNQYQKPMNPTRGTVAYLQTKSQPKKPELYPNPTSLAYVTDVYSSQPMISSDRPDVYQRPMSPLHRHEYKQPMSSYRQECSRPMSPLHRQEYKQPMSPYRQECSRPMSPLHTQEYKQPMSPYRQERSRPMSPLHSQEYKQPMSPYRQECSRPMSPLHSQENRRPTSPMHMQEYRRPMNPVHRQEYRQPMSPYRQEYTRAKSPLNSQGYSRPMSPLHRQGHRRQQQACRYFAQGRCHFGDNCKFQHDFRLLPGLRQ
ncbi:hypothetical protein Tsubulata_020222 [Turnera subulata]|uniref:C3H1-type domain-containing protein n=1 Tax=Turnera subulata TaxID=218843 RepID=A0A9Q0FX84_9ROSI|nr:hypothetical protein Tsubulata_020222 [Turnera subulata]